MDTEEKRVGGALRTLVALTLAVWAIGFVAVGSTTGTWTAVWWIEVDQEPEVVPHYAGIDARSAAPAASATPDDSVVCNLEYQGCVPLASDVDCTGTSDDGPVYVRGPVRIVGADVYGLDVDFDGIGCE
jgi:hypothetical protein